MNPGATTSPVASTTVSPRQRLHVLTDADDPIVDDAHVGAAERGAGAVSQLAADDRDGGRVDLCARRRRGKKHEERKGRQDVAST